MKKRVVILGSGTGSNFEAIAAYSRQAECSFEIVLVVSDHKEALILKKAGVLGFNTMAIECDKYKTKLDEETEKKYINALKEVRADIVVLAGFMRVLKGAFLESFKGRILNIHPSLLPSFTGLKAWEQALDYGVKYTGCTVHMVNEVLDGGRIVAQEVVEVFDYDNYDTLHRRIHEAEHKIFPKAIDDFAKNLK